MKKDTPQSNTDWREELTEDVRFLVVKAWREEKSVNKVTDEIVELVSQLLEAEKKRWVEKVEEIRLFDGGGQYENGYNTALRAVLQKLS